MTENLITVDGTDVVVTNAQGVEILRAETPITPEVLAGLLGLRVFPRHLTGEYAVVSDGDLFSTLEKAQEERAHRLEGEGHLEPFTHIVHAVLLPLTPEEEAHEINDKIDEREARLWERQREVDTAHRFQL